VASVPPTPESNAGTDALDWLRSALADIWDPALGAIDSIAATDAAATTGVAAVEVAGGVAADIVGLPVVAAVAAFTLGMYAAGWILKKITQVFPDPGIFGWHPLGFINDGLSALSKALEDQALANIHIIAAPILTLARYGAALVSRVVNIYSSLHNMGARIIGTVVPEAVGQAAQNAASDIVRLDQQIVSDGVAAIVNMEQLSTPNAARAFVPGASRSRNLSAEITGVGAAALSHAGNYTDQTAHHLETTIQQQTAKVAAEAQAQITQLNKQLTQRLTVDENVLATLTHEVDVTLPNEIATKVAEAQATEQQRLTATAQQLQGEIDGVQQQIDALKTRISQDENAIRNAEQSIADLHAQEQRDIAAIQQTLGNDVAKIQQVEQATQAKIDAQQQQITDAQNRININTGAISGLSTKITGISNTLGPVQAAQQLNTLQLAPFEIAGSVALPTVLATLTSTLKQVKTKLDTCAVETCDPTSPNNIRNVLKDLLGLLTAGAEIGFIAEAIRDPIGVADSLRPIVDGINSTASDTLSVLLSL
jgi:hypothetical protein